MMVDLFFLFCFKNKGEFIPEAIEVVTAVEFKKFRESTIAEIGQLKEKLG
jgi:hypothetical protein